MPRPRFRLAAQAGGARLDAWGNDEEELLTHAVAGLLCHVLGRAARGEAVHWHAMAPWPEDLGGRVLVAAKEALYRLNLRGEVTVEVVSAPDRGYLGVTPLPHGWSLRAEIRAVAFRSLGVSRSGRLRTTLVLADAG